MIKHTVSGKFQVSIKHKYKKIHLGTYDTFETAKQIYLSKKEELCGPLPKNGFKYCTGCDIEHPISSFYNVHRSAKCKKCFGEDSKWVHMKRKYGLSKIDFENLIRLQSGQCCVCWEELIPSNTNVDHCHKTGIVRGLLCTDCNLGLGFLKDNVNNIHRSIAYLQTGGSYAFI